ncbi:hypothetical protein N41_0706 [Lactococcus cremoris]|nr:hypothetical protein V4_0435 [Lactococcus cremoris]KZK40590.1 hypothetical protein N41_0706 [Lactococcus cremoris]
MGKTDQRHRGQMGRALSKIKAPVYEKDFKKLKMQIFLRE